MSDAYEQGKLAAANGDDEEMNPYCESDAQHDEWDDGHFCQLMIMNN